MGLFGNKERKPRVVDVGAYHVDGLDYPVDEVVLLWGRLDYLLIRSAVHEKKYAQYILEFEQIKGIEIVSAAQIIEANRSVIGRAVIGGLLLGGLGATIGAISGVGTKQKRITENYLVINYVTAIEDDMKVMSFKLGEMIIAKKFVDEIRFRAGILDASTSEHPATVKL